MASWLFCSIQSISSKVLEAIRGTCPGLQDAASPVAEANQNQSVVADLEKLSRMLARIMAVQQDAGEREINDRSVRLWLEELRGVAYQAEDVLDEYHCEVLGSIVESGHAAIQMYHQEDRGIKRKFVDMYTSSSLSYSSSSITKISSPDGMGEKIKSITERFQEISNARQDLHLREDDGTRLATVPQIRPPTSSLVDERALFGREEEKEKIISLLTPSSGPNFLVLPIVGMGGLGKTTLAQLVYNDSRIRQLFDKRSWVSVSDDFDLVRLTKAIIESMSYSPCGFSELSTLQDVLKDEINGISLFLVLDDVWNEKRNLWECFQSGFVGAKTVRILTTTRISTVAEVMQTTLPFHLGYLPEKYCWSLFKHFAFGNREAREDANLLEIGRGIVGKCKGLPLAIKVLGGILCYEIDVEKWREVLESNILEIDETGEIMPALRLSYRKLQDHLKPCFLYLSMFPKNTPFEKDMVVRLWMAQGYINGNTGTLKALEAIGSEYFDELQNRSLIDRGRWFSQYVLHDLVHDLANLENDQQCNSTYKVHHLYVTKDHELSNCLASCSDRAVRTFVNKCATYSFEDGILSKIACLRALHSMYPVSLNILGTLKHLRYLYVTDNIRSRLPESLCLLYNLQTLHLCCFFLEELPESMKNLINLQYLHIASENLKHLPESLCILYNLQTLDMKCYNLQELPGNMKNLVSLRNLHLASGKIKQLPESLCILCNLQTLDLRCYNLEDLPENMEKLVNLRHLQLHSTKIKHLPESISQLQKLHTLSLKWCCELKELPRGIEQLTELHTLDLHINVNMPYGIAKLKTLKPLTGHFNVMDHGMIGGLGELKDMNELSGLLCISGLINIGCLDCSSKANLASKPNLNKLFLDFEEADHLNCDCQETFKQNYQASSIFEKHLDALHLSVISSNATKNENVEKKQEGVLESLQPSGTITELKILHYGGKKFPSWLTNSLLQKLTAVTIDFCSEPNSLHPFGQLAYLRFLSISGGTAIKSVGDEPNTYLVSPKQPTYLLLGNGGTGVSFQSLEVLLLRNMLYLEWKTQEGDFPCLKNLNIENCPQLGKIATIPREVRELVIRDCGCHEIQFALESKIQDILISGCGELILVHSMDGDLPNLENIFISNCQKLISISWSNGFLNSAGAVILEYCPKLKLLTIPSGIKKVKTSYCGIQDIIFSFQSNIQKVDISHCPTLTSIRWEKTSFHTELSSNGCPELKQGPENLQMSCCSISHFVVKSVSHSTTKRADICRPRMDLDKIYVYQNDTVVKELNVESLEVESLTCSPLSGPSCQPTIMLNLSSLVTLEISSWSKVISVTGLDNLSNLIFLSISGCPELCDWKDRRLPIALKFLELECCDKLQSLPLLSVENLASPLKILVIINCPKLSVLEGFHGLMNLRTMELRRCRNISIPPATESLNFRPHIAISDCPLLRDWCQRNSITYCKLEILTAAVKCYYSWTYHLSMTIMRSWYMCVTRQMHRFNSILKPSKQIFLGFLECSEE
ncbi:hypothetical protein LUZ62_014702 [Rhynchospora pubera]|uniref:Uncharacterized protein n=1 Tax=Rhynchospora pubera TaxID=906938 RepID=A0AAV8GFI7_9POAL|nr:hypothetical protein LUZ62_014702 [Rhynchospora pubera]